MHLCWERKMRVGERKRHRTRTKNCINESLRSWCRYLLKKHQFWHTERWWSRVSMTQMTPVSASTSNMRLKTREMQYTLKAYTVWSMFFELSLALTLTFNRDWISGCVKESCTELPCFFRPKKSEESLLQSFHPRQMTQMITHSIDHSFNALYSVPRFDHRTHVTLV